MFRNFLDLNFRASTIKFSLKCEIVSYERTLVFYKFNLKNCSTNDLKFSTLEIIRNRLVKYFSCSSKFWNKESFKWFYIDITWYIKRIWTHKYFFLVFSKFSTHCKNFPKRYAWLSVTFLGFISFEQVTGNNRFRPYKGSWFQEFSWFKWVSVLF